MDNLKELINKLPSLAASDKKKNKTFFSRIKKNPPAGLDEKVHMLHEEVFENINCLECANCCKTLGPRITSKDIERMSSYLGIKESQFLEKYLRVDEDHDFVFKSMPCPFLGIDNYCSIYEARPVACKNYPHTDSNKFVRLLDITLKNTYICPGVFEITRKWRDSHEK